MTIYLLNILPNKKLHLQTPTTILNQKSPLYSHFNIFGSLCFPLIPSPTRNKLHTISTWSVFLGHPSNHRCYNFFELSSHQITILDMILMKTIFPFLPQIHSSSHVMNFWIQATLPHNNNLTSTIKLETTMATLRPMSFNKTSLSTTIT